MKTLFNYSIIALFLSASAICEARQAASVNASPPSPTAYIIVQRDDNSQVWERTVYEPGTNGQTVPVKRRYTELATGLNYKDPATGKWLPAREEIHVLPDGTAAATQGQHQVYFPADIYNGQIKMVTPDGKILQSRPLGLFYDDGNKTVMIAALTTSVGELVGTNQVIYPNAFVGLNADLRYTYTKSGFEQDIVLRERPLTPKSYGLNAGAAKLQVLTEFFNPPQPAIRSTTLPAQAGLALADHSLGFGAVQMKQGRAFLLGQKAKKAGAMVAKQWVQLDGRQFLVEAVPVNAIAKGLAALPLTAMNSGKAVKMASSHLALPPQRLAKTNTATTMMLAKADPPAQGFVLDYQTTDTSLENYVFQGDMTYYVSGNTVLYGTSIFEGGTVIKCGGGLLYCSGSVVCDTEAYRPAIFTSMNDDSVGEIIDGSTGTPALGDYFGGVFVNDGILLTLKHVRIAYAQYGIGGNCQLLDAQFVQCAEAIVAGNVVTTGGDVNLCNVLFSQCDEVVTPDLRPITVQGVHVTIDQCGQLSSADCYLINSILVNSGHVYGTQAGSHNGFYNAPEFGDHAVTNTFNPFQTVGAGSHYLTNGCAFRNAGTPDIDPEWLADIRTKTTHPPMVYSNVTISTAMTFGPQAPRDNAGNPDLGYHYAPLDYVFGGCDLYTNLTFTPGTVIGWFENQGAVYSAYGISLNDGADFTSTGTATQPCWIASATTVQEGGNGNWTGNDYGYMANIAGIMINGSGSGVAPQLNCQFTKWSTIANDGKHFQDNWAYGVVRISNNEFYSGGMNSYWGPQYFTNCLFYRTGIAFWGQVDAASFTFQNCTFYGGCLVADRSAGQSPSLWNIKDTSFDGTAFAWSDNFNGDTNYTAFDYNAYNTNNLSWQTYPYQPTYGMLETAGPHDQLVGGFNWQSSWLGNYYLPSDSPLIDAGSTTADQVGLHEYTVLANQQIEATNTVSIGYHYVATDQYGNPLDTYVSGIPNYLVDAAGNGMDTNGLPYWWEGQYFGQIGLDPNSQDLAGNTLLYDYQHGISPVVFKFICINTTNNYVKQTSVPLRLETLGNPGWMAVSVDDTNYQSDANWQGYSGTNLTANLGAVAGWHTVWVGLLGRGDDPTNAVWQYIRVKSDFTPPALRITNPMLTGSGAATVMRPMVQLQGNSLEPLSTITYSVSNAVGLVSGQGLVTDEFYNTNLCEFTTNAFQCFDLALTNGLNEITVQASDLAGNVTTTNIFLTLDYTDATNPPVVTLFWPQDGAQISGSQFTLRANVSDWTAGVVAQTVDTNGVTNIVSGLVERDGHVWADLPLSDGTNVITLTATDGAGNVTTTNFTVVNLPGALAINAPSQSEVSGVSVSEVDGTCGLSGCTVWVNGVKATDNGDGTWTANNVPLNPGGGTAVIAASAIPDADNGGNGSSGGGGSDNGGNPVNPQSAGAVSAQSQQNEQTFVYVSKMDLTMTYDYSGSSTQPSVSGQQHEMTLQDAHFTSGLLTNACGGGALNYTYNASNSDGLSQDGSWQTTSRYALVPGGAGAPDGDYETSWQQTNQATYVACSTCQPQYYSGGAEGTNNGVLITDTSLDAPWLAWSVWLQWWWGEAAYGLNSWQYWQWQSDVEKNHFSTTELDLTGTLTRTLQTQLRLRTGGKKVPGHNDLYCLSGSGSRYVSSPGDQWDGGLIVSPLIWSARNLPATEIQLMGKALGSDGNLWVTLPSGEDLPLPVQVAGDHYTVGVTPARYHPYINLSTATTNANLDTNAPEVCVGQRVTFTLAGLPTVVNMVGSWTLPAKFVNTNWQHQAWVVTDPITGGGYWSPYGSMHYDINNGLLQNTPSTFCWYQNKPGGKVVVGMNLEFSNGQHASVAAKGDFTVFRPTVSLVPDPHVTPSFFTAGSYPPYVKLGGGGDPREGEEHWMEVDILYKAGKYSGTGGIVQLLTMDYSNPALSLSYPSFSDWRLDGDTVMYASSTITPIANDRVFFDDEPAHGHLYWPWGTIRCKANFKDYCTFQPDGGIPVTLGIVTWSCDGESPSSGVLSTNSVVGPNGPDSSDDFPEWELNFSEGSKASQ